MIVKYDLYRIDLRAWTDAVDFCNRYYIASNSVTDAVKKASEFMRTRHQFPENNLVIEGVKLVQGKQILV